MKDPIEPDNSIQTADLVITAGRVLCAASGLDGPGGVCIRQGRIIAAGPDVLMDGVKALSFPDALLLPGLIDFHAHPAQSGSVFGIDPDRYMLSRGVTTVLSQGDAGADNVAEYVEQTINRSKTRVLLALNLSRVGESTERGCFERLEDADTAACVAAAHRNSEHVWGLAVNTSHAACGSTDPREILHRGLAAAEESGLPLLVGLRRPEDWPLAEQLQLLRSGDVVTYCYRSSPHCIVKNGRVSTEVKEARERGVRFDVGHGMASFNFDVAATALADGFPPDTISTDLQARHKDSTPLHDLPLVMSKLHAAGMAKDDILCAVTQTSGALLARTPQLGTLKPGSPADVTVLRWIDEPVELQDACGNPRIGGRWETELTVREGRVYRPDERLNS